MVLTDHRFSSSTLGAFVRSPLGARERGPVLGAGYVLRCDTSEFNDAFDPLQSTVAMAQSIVDNYCNQDVLLTKVDSPGGTPPPQGLCEWWDAFSATAVDEFDPIYAPAFFASGPPTQTSLDVYLYPPVARVKFAVGGGASILIGILSGGVFIGDPPPPNTDRRGAIGNVRISGGSLENFSCAAPPQQYDVQPVAFNFNAFSVFNLGITLRT